jgi:hypothetical protein
MSQQEYIEALHGLIDGSVEKFNTNIPEIQKQIAMKISLLIKDLDIDNQGNIVNNIKNVKIMGKVKAEVTAIVLNPDMKGNTGEFLAKFNDVSKLQNEYFKSINKSFTPTEILDEIRKQSITSTAESLSEMGLNANVIQPIVDMLQQNITTGGSWQELNKMLQDSILSNEKGLGTLERYTTTLTNDSLNQFSAQYTQTIASSLNYKWFIYTGSLIRTSRAFCEALKAKKYVHISELPQIVVGNFDEFDKEGNMNPKTGLPKGMVDGTNAKNFYIYRGGYNCGHQLTPTDEVNIPQNLREQFKFK